MTFGGGDETKFYFDFNYPLKLVRFILDQIFGRNGQSPAEASGTREWFSQPRPSNDAGTEVISCIFKLPLSISEITMEILRVPCVVEVWYLDRNNNWRQVMDMQRVPVRVYVSGSDVKSWYKYHTKVYPIVGKQLQLRITRTPDPTLENTPYVCGLRNTLIRRNVYDRAQGTAYFEEEVDVLGNIVNKYIKDWDASRAFDNNPLTFWKSEPMPDPQAVCSLFLDVRAEDGTPRLIDKLYLDPVYTGQMLNLYYSSDDTVGTRKLSPITIWPDEDVNTAWRIGRGRSDIAPGIEDAYYRFPFAVGPLLSQDCWVGFEWAPAFDPTAGPPRNPVLIRAINAGPTEAFKPMVFYDVGAAEFILQFDNGAGDTRTYTAPCTQMFVKDEPLRVMVGWAYDPDRIYIVVNNRRMEPIATLTAEAPNLPQLVSWDGQVEHWNFKGTFTACIIKLESWQNGAAFHASPTYYCNPDPVLPDAAGRIPSSSLDNAIYARSSTNQEHGTGGSTDSHFEDKEWTPIWRDYVTVKGMMFFPQPLSMKYLKLEFSNLSESPYVVYESDIEVRYKVWPTAVTQQSSIGPRLYTGEGGPLGLGTFISLNGVRHVNWLSPNSVLNAIGSVFAPQIPPVQITQGSPYITDTLPNTPNQVVDDTFRLEMSSAYVYRRDRMDPWVMAQNQYSLIVRAEDIQQLENPIDVPWEDIQSTNPSAIQRVRTSVGATPLRGDDWWVFPGQQVKLPAFVMEKLTDSSTIVERKLTLEHRIRFNSTSIHRYAYKTLKRDAAIAYFAGVREVMPYTSTYIAGEDKPVFEFSMYDKSQWVMSNIRQLEAGPVSSDTPVYRISNPSFDRALTNWLVNGDWVQDRSHGHYAFGSAKILADNLEHDLQSIKIPVEEGADIDVTAWAKWQALVATNNEAGMQLGVVALLGNTEVERIILSQVNFADWSAHANSTAEPNVASSGFVPVTGNYTVPAGVDSIRVRLTVTEEATSGAAWWDLVTVEDATPETGTIYKQFQTMSDFHKALVEFRDTGLIRSDSMWADINPDSESIEDTKLAYYTQTIPSTVPGGFWADEFKAWGGDNVEWGTPFAIVSITLDGNRRYQGKRVIHFHRAPGAGEAGIKVRQFTNWVPLGLFRIGVVFYKPFANDNVMTLRLRRLSDGVFVHEESVTAPAGRWNEYVSQFIEIPDTDDQEYDVMMTLEGDDEDELFLSDLYCDIARIRYFVRLGGIGSTLHEVSDLRYVQGYAQVVAQTPVNEMSVQAAIMSPESYAYGTTITPAYLK